MIDVATRIEREISEAGFAIATLPSLSQLKAVQNYFIEEIERVFENVTEVASLEKFHEIINPKEVNSFRVSCYNKFNTTSVRDGFLDSLEPVFKHLFGPDLAIQSNVNVSICIPGDDTANIPIHTDYHSGESAYQAVFWVPLVDCVNSMSLFFMPKDKHIGREQFLSEIKRIGRDKYGAKLNEEGSLRWLDIKAGQFVVFSPNHLHGSVVNSDSRTRWSLNFRVKNLYTPYRTQEKSIGSFYRVFRESVFTEQGRFGERLWK